ncbi:glycerophosphodiester phosphodiesterase family protein [Pontibacterium granulatum]|uniref:glycerophosphodiester phosphodiesterase family protein n=1 Tax=Pontibacterium granulatum TaxID=2036029 RepID=UPI00249B93C9|nr:glycerophosphodiester phosphodiesterase family protein [Pontibacterium granulatum]MDI3323508.1 glycerophosphodiester phosphodiesterase family protein [Pontibacterium granulatum]
MDAAQLSKRLVAHRGYQHRYPENTLRALKEAVAGGVHRLEFDIQLTADQVPVLIHDTDLYRTCGIHRNILHLNYDQLDHYSACEPWRLGHKYHGEPIPTLVQVIRWAEEQPAVELFVEIKEESIVAFGIETVLNAVLPVLRPMAKQTHLISFDMPFIAAARTRWPQVGLVLRHWPPIQDEMERCKPDILFVNKRRIKQRRHLSYIGVPVVVYEIDTIRRARYWLKHGAAYLESYRSADLLAGWTKR